MESLSCKLEWGLAQVFAISIPLTIVAMESEVYECQPKYAKAFFVGMSARNGCHGMLLERRSGAAQGLPSMKGLAKCAKGNFLGCFLGLRYLGRRPALLDFRLLAAGLRYLGLGT